LLLSEHLLSCLPKQSVSAFLVGRRMPREMVAFYPLKLYTTVST
jgi:hypothetical protein